MRDIIDHHSRSAAGVSLSTSTRSDTTKSRYWMTTRLPVVETTPTDPSPPAEGCSAADSGKQRGNRFSQHAVGGLSPRGGSGREHPKTQLSTLTNIMQKPRSRFGSPTMTRTPYGRQFAQQHRRGGSSIYSCLSRRLISFRNFGELPNLGTSTPGNQTGPTTHYHSP